MISIHAPTRGATEDMYGYHAILLFQSTLPRGERLLILIAQICNRNFNPRSHEGSDLLVHMFLLELEISIHAPTRGATRQKLI